MEDAYVLIPHDYFYDPLEIAGRRVFWYTHDPAYLACPSSDVLAKIAESTQPAPMYVVLSAEQNSSA